MLMVGDQIAQENALGVGNIIGVEDPDELLV